MSFCSQILRRGEIDLRFSSNFLAGKKGSKVMGAIWKAQKEPLGRTRIGEETTAAKIMKHPLKISSNLEKTDIQWMIMDGTNPNHQLISGKHPIVYTVRTIQPGAAFLPATVGTVVPKKFSYSISINL